MQCIQSVTFRNALDCLGVYQSEGIEHGKTAPLQGRINQPSLGLGLDVAGWFELGLDRNAPVFKLDEDVNSMCRSRFRVSHALLGVRLDATRPEERSEFGIQECFIGIAVLV